MSGRHVAGARVTAKRALDVVAAGVALTMFAPVLAAAAVAIRAEDGGPVLFRQERVGRGGAPFTVLKLRTMRDGRVTRVGARLRATGHAYARAPSLRGDIGCIALSFGVNVLGKRRVRAWLARPRRVHGQ